MGKDQLCITGQSLIVQQKFWIFHIASLIRINAERCRAAEIEKMFCDLHYAWSFYDGRVGGARCLPNATTDFYSQLSHLSFSIKTMEKALRFFSSPEVQDSPF